MTIQPICQPCLQRGSRSIFRRDLSYYPRICCSCGAVTSAGLFIRIDPATVPYPSEDS